MANHLAKRMRRAALVLLALLLSGCAEDSRTNNDQTIVISGDDVRAIRVDIDRVARDRNQKPAVLAEKLAISVDRFLAHPDKATQAAFRTAWLDAHHSFSALIPLTYIAGMDEHLFIVDAWPMEPGFLDSLPGWPDSGIINDFTLDITSAVLNEQHGITDSGEVSLGFHPLEYFAFVRPVEDFMLPDENGETRDIILRRRTTLQLIAARLSDDLLLLEERLGQALSRYLATTDTQDDLAMLDSILRTSHAAAQHAFAQAGLFVETDNGHCQYSGTSAQSLLAQVETIREIYREGSLMMRTLEQLDAVTATNLDSALDQAMEVLRGESAAEEDFAKLPLMLSAVSHQLQDFGRIVSHAP